MNNLVNLPFFATNFVSSLSFADIICYVSDASNLLRDVELCDRVRPSELMLLEIYGALESETVASGRR